MASNKRLLISYKNKKKQKKKKKNGNQQADLQTKFMGVILAQVNRRIARPAQLL